MVYTIGSVWHCIPEYSHQNSLVIYIIEQRSSLLRKTVITTFYFAAEEESVRIRKNR